MFFSFPENPSIYPVLSLREYVARTVPLRHADSKSLFVSLIKPYKCMTLQTLARWIVQLMADGRVNTNIFRWHSTCSASAALIGKTIGISVAQICKTGSWLAKSNTFFEIQ